MNGTCGRLRAEEREYLRNGLWNSNENYKTLQLLAQKPSVPFEFIPWLWRYENFRNPPIQGFWTPFLGVSIQAGLFNVVGTGVSNNLTSDWHFPSCSLTVRPVSFCQLPHCSHIHLKKWKFHINILYTQQYKKREAVWQIRFGPLFYLF